MQVYVNLCKFVLVRTCIFLLAARDLVELCGEGGAGAQGGQLPPAALQESAVL